MPDRSRRARRHPPSLWDHILGHPMQIALTIWWVIVGVVIVVAHFTHFAGVASTSDSLERLPPLLLVWLGAAVGVGGALAILGVCWPGELLTRAWQVERFGLIVAGSGWFVYLFVSTVLGTSVITATMAFSMVLSVALRLVAIRDIEREKRQDIADAEGLA